MPISDFRPKVFISYSHRDRELKEKFDTNLQVLSEQGEIQCWTDGQILPGDHWSDEITEAMNNADLIIFLVSNNFLASSFIRRKEAPMAMMRVNKGKAVIVPVILSKTPGWQKEEWNTLQALPSEVKPVDHPDWGRPENAFSDVEEKLRELISMLPQKLAKQAQQWENATQGRPTVAPAIELTPPAKTHRHVKTWFNGAAAGILLLGIAAGIWHLAKPVEPSDSPELKAWINAPKVNRTIAVVSAAKGNGYYQNGVQELSSGTEKVAARRIHQLSWAVEGKPFNAYNGICMDIAVKGVSAPLTKPVTAVVYFNAERAGDPNASSASIKVDPNNAIGSAPCAGSTLDTAPGFSHLNGSGGGPLADVWGYPTFSPQIFAGPEGVIPGGVHRIALELLIENQPIYRGVFDLIVPPLIYAQSHQEWISALASPKVVASLISNSISKPAPNELKWRMLLKGDPSQLKEPLAIQCYYSANEVGADVPLQWTVNPYEEARISRSKEIEGMNRMEFAWGDALTSWKDGSFEQPFALHCGLRGQFTAGVHQVAFEVLSRGEPVWRGIVKLDVPPQP